MNDYLLLVYLLILAWAASFFVSWWMHKANWLLRFDYEPEMDLGMVLMFLIAGPLAPFVISLFLMDAVKTARAWQCAKEQIRLREEKARREKIEESFTKGDFSQRPLE